MNMIATRLFENFSRPIPILNTYHKPPVSSWCVPPGNFIVHNDEVHVWSASLDRSAGQVENLNKTLSADEKDRAKRFHFQRDHDHFVAARGILRALLARYLNIGPSQLQFTYNPFGKPTLIGGKGAGTICFNVSHSRGLALYAIGRGRELGIDLESLQTRLDLGRMAGISFSAPEIAAFHAVPADKRTEVFLSCWTRKESYLKAMGLGLMRDIKQFDVTTGPWGKVVIHGNGGPKVDSHWSIRELVPGTHYVGAVAVKGPRWQLSCWRWPDSW